MSPPPTNIDGTDITAATIDGTEVQEITIDGETVFTAAPELPDNGNLHANYDARELSSADTFTDLKGNNDLTQIGSPTLVSNGINGRQSIQYAATDGHFLNRFDFETLTQPNTIYVVYDSDVGGSGGRRLIDRSNLEGERHLIASVRGSELGIFAGDFLEGGSTTQNPDVVTGVFNGANSELYQDDTLVATGNAGNGSMESIAVAERTDGSQNTYSGLVGNILIYETVHDSATQQEVYNYLESEWFS